MAQILLGACAFALAFAFDWVSWRRIPHLKPVLGLASGLALGIALAWTLTAPGRLAWPQWTSWIGWPLVVVAFVLLIYSLFIEIPFITTYARTGPGDLLVTTGTYALVRHPGVLWFAFWMLGWLLATRVRLLIAAGVIWVLCDIALVWLEEVVLFRRMFPAYTAYQKETPMLVPSPRSLVRCWRTWPRPGQKRA